MRKRQGLLPAAVLFLCSAAAIQAQGIYEVVGLPAIAREGGRAEMAGAVVLFLRTGDFDGGTVTVQYSAPLAEGTAPMVMRGSGDITGAGNVMLDAEEGVVMFDLPDSGEEPLRLENVRLDLGQASAPVTAAVSGDSNAIVSGIVQVVSSIEAALAVESTMASILTRGGTGMATVTIEEAFRRAFSANSMVLLRVSGVPEKAMLQVSHAGFDSTVGAANEADVAGAVTLNQDITIVSGGNIADPAGANGTLTITAAEDPIDITIDFDGPAAASSESLKLLLTLTAESPAEVELPVVDGTVRVMATMAPEEVETPDGDSEYFDENFIPAGGAVAFTFDPATCTLLFPLVLSKDFIQLDTAFAIANPSAFTTTPLSGTLRFTLFPNDGEMTEYETSGSSPGGGLDEDGVLLAGKTYTVLASELLNVAVEDFYGDFQGHIFVRADFTGCRGLGWVTDSATVNQAYLAYFGDNLDLGSIPANTSAPRSP